VDACTSNPSFDRSDTPTLPTPPAAPVTRTGPRSGVTPWSSRARTHSIAVYPAVPMAIVCAAVNAAGFGTSQSPGTRASSEYPPRWVSPAPQPFSTTSSPAAIPW
jgi:hypothetical protein